MAKTHIQMKSYDLAFDHLERAHILGQQYVYPHTLSHWYMLQVALYQKNVKEFIGQIIRLPLGVLGSAIGIVPTGNSGGSNVNMFKKMTISEELRDLMQEEIK